MKGLVFFDLDGTLLNQRSEVDEEVVIAIHELKQNGYEPLLATGRTPAEVYPIMQQTGIQSGIFMNGQVILLNGEIIIEHRFPYEVVSHFHEFTKQHQHGLAAYNAHDFKIVENHPVVIEAYNHVHSLPPAVNTNFYHEQPVTMLLLLAEAGHDEDYHSEFPELGFFRNSPYAVDIVLREHSKATGIAELCSYLQQEHLLTFAFGDGQNDLDMFKQVDIAIAMGNAIDELKQLADYVTTSHINGGIVKGLRHYQLIGDETKNVI